MLRGNATLRWIIHCVIYGFKSDTLIQLSRPLKLSGDGQSKSPKDGIPWKLSIANSFVRL
jgi:hypothetical protein